MDFDSERDEQTQGTVAGYEPPAVRDVDTSQDPLVTSPGAGPPVFASGGGLSAPEEL